MRDEIFVVRLSSAVHPNPLPSDVDMSHCLVVDVNFVNTPIGGWTFHYANVICGLRATWYKLRPSTPELVHSVYDDDGVYY